jgi:hypothetical protein
MFRSKRTVVVVQSGSAGDRLAAFMIKILLVVLVAGALIYACTKT